MPNRYKNVEDSLNRILAEEVSVGPVNKKESNAKLKEIFDFLIEEMKKQPVFKELFRQIQYVGSYYENLKIGSADEFDVDFELVIPKYIGELQVCHSTDPGFCQLKLKEDTSCPKTEKEDVKMKVKRWFDDHGFLLRSRVHQWMMSIVDNVLKVYEKSGRKHFEIRRSNSGPAVTLTVWPVSRPDKQFSIDLVPVFVFDTWPTTVQRLHKWKKEMVVKRWYAVPKTKNKDINFRLSFWHQEKHLLSDKNQLKPVLKLIKKLRDVNNWKELSSYYIKTIFLRKNDVKSKEYWINTSKSELLMEMLREIQEYLLEKKALPFYWVSENDLLGHLNPVTKENIGRRIQNMIQDIERNLEKPRYIEKYFKQGLISNNPARSTVQTQQQAQIQSLIGAVGSLINWAFSSKR